MRPATTCAEAARQIAVDQACLDAFEQELDYIHCTLVRLGTSPAAVEDRMQEVFLAVRRSWVGHAPRRALRLALFRITFRIASARRRRRADAPWGIAEAADTTPDLDEAPGSKRARLLVLAALAHIPLPRWAVLLLHDFDGFSAPEVASALDLRQLTVLWRLRRARRKLAVALHRALDPIAPGPPAVFVDDQPRNPANAP